MKTRSKISTKLGQFKFAHAGLKTRAKYVKDWCQDLEDTYYVPELKQYAKDRGIQNYSKMNKKELCHAIAEFMYGIDESADRKKDLQNLVRALNIVKTFDQNNLQDFMDDLDNNWWNEDNLNDLTKWNTKANSKSVQMMLQELDKMKLHLTPYENTLIKKSQSNLTTHDINLIRILYYLKIYGLNKAIDEALTQISDQLTIM